MGWPGFVAAGKEARLGMLANFSYQQPEELMMNGQAIPNDIRNMVITYMESLDN